MATTPTWNLLITAIFINVPDELNPRTIAGAFAVVVATIAIALGK